MVAVVPGGGLRLRGTATLDRTQFGKSIGKFQAIQHNLAIIGAHQAAAGAAALGAASPLSGGGRGGRRR